MQRYDLGEHGSPYMRYQTIDKDKDGEYVLFEDAEKLRKSLEKLSMQRHIHVAGKENIDTCAACSKDLRNPIHYLFGECLESDRAEARAILKSLENKS